MLNTEAMIFQEFCQITMCFPGQVLVWFGLFYGPVNFSRSCQAGQLTSYSSPGQLVL